MKMLNYLGIIGAVFILSLFLLGGTFFVLDSFIPAPALASSDNHSIKPVPLSFQTNPCDCSGDTLSCNDFSSQNEAQACYERCQTQTGTDIHNLDGYDNDGLVCEYLDPDPSFTPAPDPAQPAATGEAAQTGEQPESTTPVGGRNLVFNGNFEFGFYQVPELGFEPPDAGNVPKDWGWYKNNAYGKYTIDSNQRFGIVCADDLEPGGKPEPQEEEDDSPFGPIPGLENRPTPNNALELHMQSTDEMDARLGVYQTINVVPGQDYRFSMSGTIEVQGGARTETQLGPDGTPVPQAPNHTFELYFDHTGGTNWRAIPFEKWINVPLDEERLFFSFEETERKGEGALAEIDSYETIVTARTNKMTIFITGWRKWANWRTAKFTVDCVSLVPVNLAGNPNSGIAAPPPAPTPYVDIVQPASITEGAAQPEDQPQSGATSTEPQNQPQVTESELPTTGAPAESNPIQPEPAPAQPQPETIPAEAQPEIAIQNQAEDTAAQPETEPVIAETQPEAAPAQPETVTAEPDVQAAPAEEASGIIPTSGGILENTGSKLLFGIAAVVVIFGLIGAGVWNMRRR